MPGPRNIQNSIVQYLEEDTNSDLPQGDLPGIIPLERNRARKEDQKDAGEYATLKDSHGEQKDSVGSSITPEQVHS